MAALAVGLLVMPYAKPLACGLTDHGAVASHHPGDVEEKSSDGSDDGGGCHDSLTCNLRSRRLPESNSRTGNVPTSRTQGAGGGILPACFTKLS
jgi:hypothetical protein